jgi:hypothetical protein
MAFGYISLCGLVGGLSSAGRAPALQAGGHRFDPDRLHHATSATEDEEKGLLLLYAAAKHGLYGFASGSLTL